ncbi:hypothetical protein COU93_02245 [Candidatus Shapirobacteria bacterium CG10_big_fil_rev_8_21_14_0_10_36_6]|uniref:General secretion pathway GspH domain-containing protein n=1 Tax=Candidatus Shapirobacteria bacterium CG10_big_fil_rev_8_21_14_0_10_36_6 TaxID=1974886 RepID=A0A2M8L1R2_9BACT|nr:MAG: hypothetical protein COU93_02245 [Candidatus Shapirobacteria bacterium CG10_big_fil_rev_8_21_14_0_10_36_6]
MKELIKNFKLKIKNCFLGFTLIELMVAIALMIIFAGSGVVYLNNFNVKQKLDKAKAEVVSMVKMSQNYAKIKQTPVGNSDEVRYVRLRKNGSNIEADINGIGTTYFSSNITDNGLTITFDNLYFWGGSGQLSSDVNGTFFGPTDKVNITITLNQGISETRVVVINSLGGVE